jgi:3-phenylpropionate/cinnamic acid dioxygenase small subunit
MWQHITKYCPAMKITGLVQGFDDAEMSTIMKRRVMKMRTRVARLKAMMTMMTTMMTRMRKKRITEPRDIVFGKGMRSVESKQ